MKIRWSNVPVPEAYVIAVVAAAGLHLFIRRPVAPPSASLALAGAALVAAGLGLAAWAVVAARDSDIEHPTTLVTTGPFALSRNPMYLGWTALCLGLALLVNSLWLLIAAAAAWLYTHLATIPGEERSLRERFGSQYEDYIKRVRRYL